MVAYPINRQFLFSVSLVPHAAPIAIDANGPYVCRRFGLLAAIGLSISLHPGFSLGACETKAFRCSPMQVKSVPISITFTRPQCNLGLFETTVAFDLIVQVSELERCAPARLNMSAVRVSKERHSSFRVMEWSCDLPIESAATITRISGYCGAPQK